MPLEIMLNLKKSFSFIKAHKKEQSPSLLEGNGPRTAFARCRRTYVINRGLYYKQKITLCINNFTDLKSPT